MASKEMVIVNYYDLIYLNVNLKNLNYYSLSYFDYFDYFEYYDYFLFVSITYFEELLAIL